MRECNSRWMSHLCLVCNCSLFQLIQSEAALHSKVSTSAHLEDISYWCKNPKADGGVFRILHIGEERSDVETGVLIFMANSTSSLPISGIYDLFSSRVNSMFKRRTGKKHLKISLKNFSYSWSNSLENMSSSDSLISQRTHSKLASFSGRFALFFNDYVSLCLRNGSFLMSIMAFSFWSELLSSGIKIEL